MPVIVAPYGPWEPAPLAEVAAIFAALPGPWWIAGGHAIELAVGRPFRAHADIDVLVLRKDHLHLQAALRGWEWWADWVSRRDPRIRRPLARIGHAGPDGIPYLAPEIQLFYKARKVRPKDEADFTAALPVLTAAQRQWLGDALLLAYGAHPWGDRLRGPASGRPGAATAT
ncbi:MAG TPA: amino acid transporter [Streptosporangiaceae bacterium]|nr:amino acid transporter [Streptosporangiaceae bacterium]